MPRLQAVLQLDLRFRQAPHWRARQRPPLHDSRGDAGQGHVQERCRVLDQRCNACRSSSACNCRRGSDVSEQSMQGAARITIHLVCWHCGQSRAAEVPHEPQFAFQVAGWANDVGMKGYLDMYRGRALVFCSEEHAAAERTKAGFFRARPKGPSPAPKERA